ncbi:hypothetical protein BSLG_010444 [Batrachochytrium salamandrivorans]|nr:hypothetical protein BSLG_010444 [Batrachochytrium salamandrivorans]
MNASGRIQPGSNSNQETVVAVLAVLAVLAEYVVLAEYAVLAVLVVLERIVGSEAASVAEFGVVAAGWHSGFVVESNPLPAYAVAAEEVVVVG